MPLPLVRLLSGFKQKPAYVGYFATLFLVCVIGLASTFEARGQAAPEDIAGSYTGSTAATTASNCLDLFDNGPVPSVSVNVRLFQPTINGATRTVTGLITVAYAGPNGEDLILNLSATLSPPGNNRTLSAGTLAARPPFNGGGTFTGQWTRGTPDALTLNFNVSGTAFSSTCTVTGTVNDVRLGPPPPITFTQGILTQPQSALDPAVQATQQNGTFTIKPRSGTPNLHYNGFVSDQFINLNDFSVAVEVKQTATGGAETVFSIGDDPNNFYRFVKIDGTRPPAAFDDGDSIRAEYDNTTATPAFLFFQIKVDGIPASFNIPYDPVLHRFWRFRHEKLDDTINFETSPDQATWTVRHKVANKKGVSEMTAELSAGTSASVTDPGTAIFGTFMLGDNFSIAGQVKNSANAGLPGVKVDLSGWTSLTTMTDSNGKYSFAPLDAGKNYVVKLSLAGYTFSDQIFNALNSDKIVEVAATECSFTLAATNISVSSAATVGSVGLTASASDCASSAVSNVPWISVTSGASGAGNRSVGYSVAANTSSAARSGTLTIGGKTFTVNQAGVVCSFALSSPASSVSASAGTGSVGFTVTASDCAWTASSNASWITITSAAGGTGNGTVNYSVALNTGSTARNGTFTIGGQTFTVNQAAPTFEVVALIASQAEIKIWTLGGRTYAYLKLLFPNAGYRVSNWGQATKAGNDFTADAAVERFTGGSVQAVTTTAQIYDLGPLANGTYNFNFKTSGTLAKTLQFTLSSTVPPPNPIDIAREFVKQQYRDFLNREADPAGENFWTDNITKCSDPARRPAGQTEAQCTLRQRETTSGAFFLSPEFQYTGYYVYRMYQGGLGRQPKLSEFIPDAQFVGNGIVVNGQLSGAKINQNKADFAAQFVNCTDATKYRCSEFKSIYDGLSNTQYVDKLFQTTGVNASATDRAALVNGLNANPATETRASVLQKVVDGITVVGEGNQQFTTTYGQSFYNSELNRAFVELEYFGYMKRDPDDAGYAFWLGKLNQFGGNFVNAEMVLAFISSPEYRARFGQP